MHPLKLLTVPAMRKKSAISMMIGMAIVLLFAEALGQPRPQASSTSQRPLLSACDQFIALGPDTREPEGLRELARTEALAREDVVCASVVASRYVASRQCGRARELASYASDREPGLALPRCIRGLARTCEVIADATRAGGGDAIDCASLGVTPAVSDLAIACLQLEDDPTAAAAALAALTDLSWLCIDRGQMLAAATGLASAYHLQSREIDRLRERRLPRYLSDSLLVSKLRDFLQVRDHASGVVPLMQRRARDLLTRLASEGPLPSDDVVLVTARALLIADGLSTAEHSSAYGSQIEDLEFLAHHQIVGQPLVAQAAAQLRLLWPASAAARPQEVERLSQLRNVLARYRSPELQFVRFRLGLAVTIRENGQDPCERARGLLAVNRDFYSSEDVAPFVQNAREEFLEAARSGRLSARRCVYGGDGMALMFEWMVSELEQGRVPRSINLNFHAGDTP